MKMDINITRVSISALRTQPLRPEDTDITQDTKIPSFKGITAIQDPITEGIQELPALFSTSYRTDCSSVTHMQPFDNDLNERKTAIQKPNPTKTNNVDFAKNGKKKSYIRYTLHRYCGPLPNTLV
ncbi:hypothetical protein LOAG_00236 [Loa loa]|uniref:Uncharacterized protein n=1 Tax=Loa loa TaxID=7209 RepID=A0A1S0UBW5_LOALO|nr:hypothetical protein LOAG_00236 [Loa loa]EFO28241.1 hypothetical protein LOAG_00236 [Loa loa]